MTNDNNKATVESPPDFVAIVRRKLESEQARLRVGIVGGASPSAIPKNRATELLEELLAEVALEQARWNVKDIVRREAEGENIPQGLMEFRMRAPKRMMVSYPGLPSDEPHEESPDCRGQGCIPLDTLKAADPLQPASESNIDFAMQMKYDFRAIENSCSRRGITIEIYFEEQKLRSLELYKRWKDDPNKEVKFP